MAYSETDQFRPMNTCDDCDYMWHPRGHNLSIKCPDCRSTNVRIIVFGEGRPRGFFSRLFG